jgi:hypothetical protein
VVKLPFAQLANITPVTTESTAIDFRVAKDSFARDVLMRASFAAAYADGCYPLPR